MGVATSTQAFLSYPDICLLEKRSEKDTLQQPIVIPKVPPSLLPTGSACSWTLCPGQSLLNARKRSSSMRHLRRQSRVHPCGSLTLDLWEGHLVPKEISGETRSNALRDVKQNLPLKIRKSHCPRAGWLERQSRREGERGVWALSCPSRQSNAGSFGPQHPPFTRWHSVVKFWLRKG